MRMIHAYVISILAIGCADRETRALTRIEQSMLKTNEVIRQENTMAIDAMNKRWAVSITGGPVVDWAPKAKALHVATMDLDKRLYLVNDSISRGNGGSEEVSPSLRRAEQSLTAFVNEYRRQIRAILYDSTTHQGAWRHSMNIQAVKEADSAFFSMIGLPGPIRVDWEKGIESQFKNLLGNDHMAAVLAIDRIGLALGLMERRLVGLCNENGRGYLYCGYEYSYIAQLDREQYSVGDTITVHLGKAEIVTYKCPKISVAGSALIDNEGTATYSWIASGAPGVYTLPVQYEYEKPNGGKLSWSKNIQYVIEK